MKKIIAILITVMSVACSVVELEPQGGDFETLLNSARKEPVSWNAQMQQAAEMQVNYMDSCKRLEHNWADGTNLQQRLEYVG